GVARLPQRPEGITWTEISGQGAAVVQRGPRIAVVRRGRELWRSTRPLRAAGAFALVGPHAIAVGYDRTVQHTSLFLAPLGGRERLVARDEQPLGWLRNGDLATWSYRGSVRVRVRAPDGSLLRADGRRFRAVR